MAFHRGPNIITDGLILALDADNAIVKIYNRALTPQEIQQNYNATKGRFGL